MTLISGAFIIVDVDDDDSIVISVVVCIIVVIVVVVDSTDADSVRTKAGVGGNAVIVDVVDVVGAISGRSAERNELPVIRPAGIVDISKISGDKYVTYYAEVNKLSYFSNSDYDSVSVSVTVTVTVTVSVSVSVG